MPVNRLFQLLSGDRPQLTPQTATPPAPGMLGSGMAANAATSALMREFQTRQAIAQASGEDFPATFEEWVKSRQ